MTAWWFTFKMKPCKLCNCQMTSGSCLQSSPLWLAGWLYPPAKW